MNTNSDNAKSPYEILKIEGLLSQETLEVAFLKAKQSTPQLHISISDIEKAYAALSSVIQTGPSQEDDVVSLVLLPQLPDAWHIATPLPDKSSDQPTLPFQTSVRLRNQHTAPRSEPPKIVKSLIGMGFKTVVPTKVATHDSSLSLLAKLTEQTGTFDGNVLMALRQNAGITIEDVAHRTKISLMYLQALEKNAYNQLPAQVYMRGYLNSYLGYLGIIDQTIVGKFADHYRNSR